MSVLRKPRVRKAAQLSIAGVVAAAAVAVGAVWMAQRAASRGPAPIWPAPDPPWKQTADAALGRRLAMLDGGLTVHSVWRCERAECGFEGRYTVLAPKSQAEHEVRSPARLQVLMGAIAPAFEGDVAWPALADGQAQTMRLPQGYAYVIAQSDRAGPGAGVAVAGQTLDRMVSKVMAQARPGGAALAPAPARDRAPQPAAAPPKPVAPAIPVPEEQSNSGAKPGWR